MEHLRRGEQEAGLTPWADMVRSPQNKREESAAHKIKSLQEAENQCLTDYASLVEEYRTLEKTLRELVEKAEDFFPLDETKCPPECPCVKNVLGLALTKAKALLPKGEKDSIPPPPPPDVIDKGM